MPRVTEFDLRHDDFHIDGMFNFVEPLLIEVSVDIHGCFTIESVRLLLADDHAVSVPPVISDFVGCWALTSAGKKKLQEAYEAAQPDDGESYIYEAPCDHRSIWGRNPAYDGPMGVFEGYGGSR